MNLNPFQDGDNFYVYQVAGAIMSMAAVKVQARLCHGGPPAITKHAMDGSF
eukprot:CAMPEP_0171202632 /NCGR_PEP_ID=MMETSP0790-20130122/25104_1 /TAXON_ID=2925 /ORGANISM="Alexandrium catenella, Strain OF101" /LENGTH=50 /DNA_ID=CAMNT_0011668065 /DNA_START=1 /DNA_END=150 /DNA_ORIENTATION=-